MARRIIFTLVFLTSFALFSTAQQVTASNILGKWVLYRHTADSTLMYDADNPDVMINYGVSKLKEAKPNYTAEDSITIMKRIVARAEGLKKIFIQFNANGTYVNTKIIGDGTITDDVEGGGYRVDVKEQTITQTDQTGKTLAMKVSLSNNILRLTMLNSLAIAMEYRKQ
jgi:hypothetical protein